MPRFGDKGALLTHDPCIVAVAEIGLHAHVCDKVEWLTICLFLACVEKLLSLADGEVSHALVDELLHAIHLSQQPLPSFSLGYHNLIFCPQNGEY